MIPNYEKAACIPMSPALPPLPSPLSLVWRTRGRKTRPPPANAFLIYLQGSGLVFVSSGVTQLGVGSRYATDVTYTVENHFLLYETFFLFIVCFSFAEKLTRFFLFLLNRTFFILYTFNKKNLVMHFFKLQSKVYC